MINVNKSQFIFILVFLFAFKTKAQWVTINDANFVTFLQQSYPSCMNGNLMDTTCSDITNDTLIIINSLNIQNLDGIQYFDALKFLKCESNGMLTIPALPSSLTTLQCGFNYLTSLPVLPAGLIELYCTANQLTYLPALPVSLQRLICDANQISNLPDPLPSLTLLKCSSNDLDTLPTLPASLLELNCCINQITTLPSLPSGLTDLDCHSNPFTNLPSLPNSLKNLNCEQNYLTSLPVLPTSLLSLFCGSNQLTSLPALPASLKNLYCYYNQLSTVPQLPTGMLVLDCHGNQITFLPTLPLTLKTLTCNNNQLSALPSLPGGLTNLNFAINQVSNLTSIPVSLINLTCYTNLLTALPALPSTLTILHCSNNQLSSLPSLLNGLTNLYCENNQLTSLPELPQTLSSLNASFNQITCFPVLPNSLNNSAAFSIASNPFTCLPNYVPAMTGTSYLNYPLCIDTNLLSNPNLCTGFKGVYGKTFKDLNNNCILDGAENMVTNIPVDLFDSTGALINTFYTLTNGAYNYILDTATYMVAIDTNAKPYVNNCLYPGVDSVFTLTTTSPLAKNINFEIECKSGFDVGVKSINTTGRVFPGLTHRLDVSAGDLSKWYNLNCANGINGTVVISVSGNVTYNSIPAGVLTPNNISGNIFTYAIADFGTINLNDFAILLTIDTSAQLGDQVCVSVNVTPTIGDNDTTNNQYTFCYEVVNSFDPNQKEVYPNSVPPLYSNWFTYTIHFQNLGNAPAQNIRVVDTLDSNLDVSTFEIINYSHANTSTLTSNIATFRFPNIQLSDSATNPEGSKGFIQYRIKPLLNLPLGTQIENTAHIYFDFNVPVTTNTAVSNFNSTVGVVSFFQANDLSIYPNPGNGWYHLSFKNNTNSVKRIEVLNQFGKIVYKHSTKRNFLNLDLEQCSNGIYILKLFSAKGNFVIKIVKQQP